MLTITRSPLASPALRTMASASCHVAPSSPLFRPSASTLPHVLFPITPRTPKDQYPNTAGTPVCGSYFPQTGVEELPARLSYFSFVGNCSTPCRRLSVPCSPSSGASTPTPMFASIPSITSHGSALTAAIERHASGGLTVNDTASQAASASNSSAGTSVEPQTRHKLTFKLAFPIPCRGNSFETAGLDGVIFSLDAPGVLTWSDSSDSVMTLRPIRGRVATPYPKMDDSEWIQDVDEAIMQNSSYNL